MTDYWASLTPSEGEASFAARSCMLSVSLTRIGVVAAGILGAGEATGVATIGFGLMAIGGRLAASGDSAGAGAVGFEKRRSAGAPEPLAAA